MGDTKTSCAAICDTDESESDLEEFLDHLKRTMGNEKLQDAACPDRASQLLDCITNLRSVTKCNGTIEANTNLEEAFLILLLTHKSKGIVSKAANAVAEIARTDRGREKCTSEGLVRTLTDLLKEENVDVLAQACRALGNICYENACGNELIASQGGAEIILTVLERGVASRDTEGASFLREVATGLLLNFLVFYKEIHTKQVLLHRIVSLVTDILETDTASSGETVTHALRIIEIVNDFVVLDEKLQKLLFDILASNASFEHWEICLEIIHGRVIKDEKARLSLAEAGVCELICQFVETYGSHCNDEDRRPVLQFACNMLLEYCSRDDSMKLLYDNDKGVVYQKLVEWLEIDEPLVRYIAVIAVNNFACNDEHCKRMVERGLHRKVLRVLKECNRAPDVKLQCGLLGILHRLAIHADNKPILLADGLFEVLYTMLDNPNLLVIPYLLDTFRIAIRGQREPAISLAQREGFIEQLVKWRDIDCPGIQAETSRLIAWLVNNSRDRQIALLIIRNGAVKPLVDMLLAQHPLMRNEALASLKVITRVCLAESEAALIDNDFGDKMRSFLEKPTENLDAHIVLNALSLLQYIVSGSDRLKEHLNQRGMLEACKAVHPNEDEDCAEDLKSQLADLMAMLSSATEEGQTSTEKH